MKLFSPACLCLSVNPSATLFRFFAYDTLILLCLLIVGKFHHNQRRCTRRYGDEQGFRAKMRSLARFWYPDPENMPRIRYFTITDLPEKFEQQHSSGFWTIGPKHDAKLRQAFEEAEFVCLLYSPEANKGPPRFYQWLVFSLESVAGYASMVSVIVLVTVAVGWQASATRSLTAI